MKAHARLIVVVAGLALSALPGLALTANGQAGAGQAGAPGQGRAGAPQTPPPPPPPPFASNCDFAEGTTARYKVAEQLVGISFGNEAVGSTQAVTGTLALAADGTVNPAQSKILVDLKTLKSDQALRDGYLQRNTLQTDKFPTLEFVPKRATGLPSPFPTAQRPTPMGVQLVGDMTLHGVTAEVTWNVAATVTGETIAGRALTSFPFSTFNLTKPSVPLLASADDKIQLEVEFRCKRTPI